MKYLLKGLAECFYAILGALAIGLVLIIGFVVILGCLSSIVGIIGGVICTIIYSISMGILIITISSIGLLIFLSLFGFLSTLIDF